MAGPLGSLVSLVLPRRRGTDRGVATTNTFNPSATETFLPQPRYREHTTDLFTSRQSDNSNELLQQLFRHDSDISAAVNAYLTVADTEMRFVCYDMNGEIDREGIKTVQALITALGTRWDYSKGFLLKPDLRSINEKLRYMVLLRGAASAELVLDRQFIPSEFRLVDPRTLRWFETQSSLFKPIQIHPTTGDEISLDIPNFFVTFYRQDPTTIYSYSPFVSAINLVAARQQVINDMYRIIQRTGFPRIEVTVLEEVLRKNAPAEFRADEVKMRQYIGARIGEITSQINSLRADSAFVHLDSVQTGVMNKEGPRQALDIRAIIEVLNAQNQAALKTMATVIGRGEQGVNTGTVEARVFSLNAEQLNRPIAELWSKALTLALRLQGSESIVDVRFDPVEMRPKTELEPMLTVRQTRMMEALSHGLITDDEFHMQMYGRPRPDNVQEMMGTGFYGNSAQVDTGDISPNSDPMGRSIAPSGSESARSNTTGRQGNNRRS